MNANDLLNDLVQGKDLSREKSRELARMMFSEVTPQSLTGAILTALKVKEETSEEILGFVEVLREGMNRIHYDGVLVDTCGTGGDGKNTFNISTAAAIVVAACGVKVAKHGNRSASGTSGSADVLEALGVNINADSSGVVKSLDSANIAFLFAPLFHPLMKSVGPIRRELKIRTIFNLIGPLLNPIGVKRQIIGVSSHDLAEKLSLVIQALAYEHVLVIHSDDGMDEVSIYGKTEVIEIKNGKITKFVIDPADFNLTGKNRNEIQIKDINESKQKLLQVLNGSDGDLRKTVLINSGAALYVSGKYKNIKTGIAAAEEAILSGKTVVTLNNLIKSSNSTNE